MTDPPSDPKKEAAAAIIRGAVSGIPILGGVISEVGNLYFNPLEKRKQKWNSEIASAIAEIEERFDILPEQLATDERFISFLFQTTIISLKNHQKEKIRVLRNVVVSVANPEQMAEDVAFQFLRYVDELTPSHLHILACLNRHVGQFDGCESLEQVYGKFSELSSLEIDRITFRSFLHDLDARFLIRLGDVEELPEFESKVSHLLLHDSSIKRLTVTSLGHLFLEFIDETAP